MSEEKHSFFDNFDMKKGGMGALLGGLLMMVVGSMMGHPELGLMVGLALGAMHGTEGGISALWNRITGAPKHSASAQPQPGQPDMSIAMLRNPPQMQGADIDSPPATPGMPHYPRHR